jgi:type IV secretion system protein VirD4
MLGFSVEFHDLPRGIPQSHAGTGEAPRALWRSPNTLIHNPNWQYKTGKILLGSLGHNVIGVSDNRHLLTVAGSRAGKGTSAIIPNLLTYTGSVLVLDPKGENASITAERRGIGRDIPNGGLNQDVFVLDPFNVADVHDDMRAGFDPFAYLNPDSPDFIDDCDNIADALIVAQPGKENDHWNGSARLIIRGFIAWVAAASEIENRNLLEVNRLLFLALEGEDEDSLAFVLAEMRLSPHIAHGIPTQAANTLLSMGERERGSVLSTIRQNLAFLSSPSMAHCLSGELRSPDIRKWKFGDQSIYLCLPAGRLHRYFRFFRLFINQLLAAVESEQDVPETPALMILDEMHVLGHMAALETAAGLFAGFGVRIWSIWQDLAQLKHLYKTRWETFIGNASVLQFFGLNDMTTLEWVSRRLGKSSILKISQNEQSLEDSAQGYSAQSRSIQETPLLSPDEVAYFFSRESNNQLIIFPGSDPIFLKRLPYYTPYFQGMYNDR